MRRVLMLGAVLVVASGAAGCVSNSTYQAAVAETEAAKNDLANIRSQKNALEQQVKNLKDANGKIIAEAELAQAELERLKESREKERENIEGRIREQELKIKELTTQHRALRQEYDDAKQRNETLTAAVARYQKELKDRQNSAPPMDAAPKAQAPPAAAPKPPMPPTPPAPPSRAPAPMAKAPAPAPPAPASQSAALAPVNVNTASANDMVLFLGLTKEVADRIVSNRPYKVRGELVAKNVLPKATYDVIKDRITVAP